MSKTIETKDKLVTAESLKWVHDKLDLKIDGGLFQEFDETATYAVGDYVIYNGYLYKMTHSHTGAWDASDAEQVDFMESLEDLSDRELSFTDPNNDGNIVIVGNNTAVVDDAIYAEIEDVRNDLASEFEPGLYICQNSIIWYNDDLYLFKGTEGSSSYVSSFDSTAWEKVNLEDLYTNLKARDQAQQYLDLKKIADEYTYGSTYEVGDLIIDQTITADGYPINGWKLYKCVEAVTEAEDRDPAKWADATIDDVLKELRNEVSELQSDFNSLGFSVIDGKLNVTYTI